MAQPERNYNIDKNLSWFIGDRDSDIICGKNSGLKTIFINERNLSHNLADYNVKNLLNNLLEDDIKESFDKTEIPEDKQNPNYS